MLCSCSEDSSNSVEKTADQIEGTYNLIKITWEGKPLDINNDGIVSNNLYPELMSLSTNAGNEHHATVLSFSLDRSKGAIGMCLPMQNVSVTYDGRYPTAWMIGNALPVSISYHIDPNGTLFVDHFDSLNLPENDSRIEMKRMNNGTVSFGFNGHMSFRVGYTLYDHQTGQLVEGTILYVFERIES